MVIKGKFNLNTSLKIDDVDQLDTVASIKIQNSSFELSLKKFEYPALDISKAKDKHDKNCLDIHYKYVSAIGLRILISNDTIKIFPDSSYTLGIYYYFEDGIFYFHNNIAGLVEMLQEDACNLNPNLPLGRISDQVMYQGETCIKRIYPLMENFSLEVTRNGVNRHYIGLPEIYFPEYANHYEMVASLSAEIQQAFKNYFPKHLKVGSLFSGGRDSAIITNELVKYFGKNNTVTYSQLLGEYETYNQKQKIIELVEKLGINSEFIDISSRDLYFAGDLENPYYSTFANHFNSIADLALKSNVSVVFSGVGGDECFSEHASIDHDFMYYSESFENASENFNELVHIKDKQIQEIPLVTPSTRGTFLADNNVFLEKGIWYFSPFMLKEIMYKFLVLNTELKENDSIYTSYFLSNSFPQIYTQFNSKEKFKPYTHERLVKHKTFIEKNVNLDISLSSKYLLLNSNLFLQSINLYKDALCPQKK